MTDSMGKQKLSNQKLLLIRTKRKIDIYIHS